MKNLMYRQPRTAAIIYASTPEELHNALLKRRKKLLHTVLLVLLGIASVAVSLFFLRKMKAEHEAHRVTGTVLSHEDPLCPESVRLIEKLSSQVLRLHILANSDSAEDQSVKLIVRDAILAFLTEPLSDCHSKGEVKEAIASLLPEILDCANETLRNAGYAYTASGTLTVADFPLKVYGDIFLPAGTYETLQITLGEAEGQNWWCLIFPSLCFVDSVLITEEWSESNEPSPTPEPERTLPRDDWRNILELREYEAIRVEPSRVTFEISFLNLFRFLD